MSNDPDQIREQIALTRGTLSSDVNTLADTVRPGNVARRQVDKARGAATSAKDKIMGTASDLGSSASDLGASGSSALRDAASSSQQSVRAAPGAVTAQTQGNPLAAGLIAFGTGWLIASLIPATRSEQRAAVAAKENASVVTEPVIDAAKQVGGNLQGPAQEAVDAVKSTATDAADTVRSEGTSAVQDVKDQSIDAKQAVQDSRA
jgi:Protein of unknown function (DUF3618)